MLTRGAPLSDEAMIGPPALGPVGGTIFPVGLGFPPGRGTIGGGGFQTREEFLSDLNNPFLTPEQFNQRFNAPPAPAGGTGMDLGNILGGLATEFIRAKFTPTGVSINQLPPAAGFAPGALAPSMPGLSQLGVPGVDVIREGMPRGYCYDPNANGGQGKWIKRSRRRRKRLATASDIADIAALMGAFQVKSSQPSSLTTWIATRGR